MTSDVLRCTLAGLLKKLAGVKEMAISNGHTFDDHVHQSFWGSNYIVFLTKNNDHSKRPGWISVSDLEAQPEPFLQTKGEDLC